MITPTHSPLPDNTQQSQGTYSHDPVGIRTRNRSKRADANPHLRPRGHWDWRFTQLWINILISETIPPTWRARTMFINMQKRNFFWWQLNKAWSNVLPPGIRTIRKIKCRDTVETQMLLTFTEGKSFIFQYRCIQIKGNNEEKFVTCQKECVCAW